ncbi:hydrolase [Solimicrobium silvestre]|uniref:Putative hydrolase of the alpha/beta-hydrolase fold n=1 Tax=Solimicrobium silvestre TaxID=2099400 RepID=A0A2S9GXE8_9BURK|nr:hydrolase [Solimicrobium silvestre]PRC92397.1 putative hydrolase of the alpha/beta-hydrolase fold [Solimicrobium silvestre]
MQTNYVSPAWMSNGHLQTIIPAKLLTIPTVSYRRERWNSPDNDFIDLDFVDAVADAPLVVLFHGLEGNSNSHYARALMAEVKSRGWAGVVVHFRGCSGEMNQGPRFYHSGDSTEINWVLRRIHQQHPQRSLFVCGVSLGGNALLRWLGESQNQASFVQAACAVSAPLDLTQGGVALGSGFNMLYTTVFLRTLKPKCLAKLAQYPDLFNRQTMLDAKNLYEFDNVVTAPLHGYKNTEDYWNRASAKHILGDITLPTLVLNAKNDPFLPGRYLPENAASCVTLEYPQHGGHVGFAGGSWRADNMWLPKRVLHFFEQYQPA